MVPLPAPWLHYQEALACETGRLVAVHVYKAAGTTFNRLLRRDCTQTVCWSAGYHPNCGFVRTAHDAETHNAPWADWMLHADTAFVFAAVREHWLQATRALAHARARRLHTGRSHMSVWSLAGA
jgi:hypothetical protein